MAITRFATKVAAETNAGANGQVVWVVDRNGNNWESRTASDVIQDPRPTVSQWQLVQACIDAGYTEAQLDAAVLTLTPKRQRFWKYSTVIDRDNPMSGLLRAAILPTPPTPHQWNAIFIAASQLDPFSV